MRQRLASLPCNRTAVVSVFQRVILLLPAGLPVYKWKTATSPTQCFVDHVALALQELGFHATLSLFHLLSVALARFQELQTNITFTASQTELPAYSHTGIHCTHTGTQTYTRGLRSSVMWRRLTGLLVPASGPHIHCITPRDVSSDRHPARSHHLHYNQSPNCILLR